MTAIEDARAALASNEEMSGVLDASWTVRRLAQTDTALRALIAEHERLAEELDSMTRLWQRQVDSEIEHAEELIEDRMEVQEELARLTAPPSDDDIETLSAFIDRDLAWAEGDPDKLAAALIERFPGFRRQGPITDALREWIGGEPYEVSCARAGHPVETTSVTDPQLAFIDGYQRAVHHVAAILEAAKDAS